MGEKGRGKREGQGEKFGKDKDTKGKGEENSEMEPTKEKNPDFVLNWIGVGRSSYSRISSLNWIQFKLGELEAGGQDPAIN